MAVTDPKKARRAKETDPKKAAAAKRAANKKARLAKKAMPKRPTKKVSRVRKVKPPTAAQKLKSKGKATVRLGRAISKRDKAKGKVVKQAGRALKKKGRQTARAARVVKSDLESIRTRKWLS